MIEHSLTTAFLQPVLLIAAFDYLRKKQTINNTTIDNFMRKRSLLLSVYFRKSLHLLDNDR